MTQGILQWLGGGDTGQSSKALALAALGAMPSRPGHPHDGDDIGRCFRLLDAHPEAQAGLAKLAKDGGPYWSALAAKWSDLRAAYDAETKAGEKGRTYREMRAILDPIDRRDPSVINLGPGVTVRRGA
jgi:hypothetical protein